MSRISGHPNDAHHERRRAALVVDVSRRVRQALADAIVRIGDDPSADHPALTVPRARVPLAPAQLASSHPGRAEDRQQARALYERCLTHYRDVVRVEDTTRGADDVGAAVARFVAANFEALQDVQASPEILLRLERQLGGLVRLSSAWATASARDRQSYFERMAIIAVLIKETSALAAIQGPAAIDNVQRAARGYLKQLIGLDPDHLRLGADGLSLRAADSDGAPSAPAASA